MLKLGIDLGGTKIEIIALDDKGAVLFRERESTPARDYQRTLQAIAGLVNKAERSLGQKGTIGIGTPGALSKVTGRLKNANSTSLNGHFLLQDLEKLLQRSIRIANDADCFTLSEATDGAAVGMNVVFGVILGTGVGAGISVKQHLLNGPNAITGEWGHNPLPWAQTGEYPGQLCYCGKSGCIETFLSGPGLANAYRLKTGNALDAREIIARAGQGDSSCVDVIASYENRLARSLAHVINILDPDVIVLGGGLSNYRRLYTEVPKIWGDYVFSDRVDTRLLPPKFGDSSGVRGAAWLWNG